MKITKRLVRKKSDSETGIYLDINHQGNRKKWGTGLSIHPELWNFGREIAEVPKKKDIKKKHEKRFKSLSAAIANLNTALRKIESNVEQYKLESLAKKQECSINELIKYLNSKHRKKATLKSSEYIFLTDYSEYVFVPGASEGSILRRGGKRYAASTIKTYKSMITFFKNYEKSAGEKIKFEEVDFSFYNKLMEWSNYKKFSLNYIGKRIRELKKVLKFTYKKKIHKNRIFEDADFIAPREDVTSVYLKRSEIKNLQSLELNQVEEKYRDAFLVGVYTAMRIGDYTNLTDRNLERERGQLYIKKITEKTKNQVRIPVMPELKEILQKDGFFKRPKIYEQKLNKYIKNICKKAGIDDPVEIKQTIGGKTLIREFPKYEKVSSHTARRTGATLMYLSGIPIIEIMKITGHKTVSSFMKYICITSEETSSTLSNHSYFKNGITA